jgi:hypothetical protein
VAESVTVYVDRCHLGITVDLDKPLKYPLLLELSADNAKLSPVLLERKEKAVGDWPLYKPM